MTFVLTVIEISSFKEFSLINTIRITFDIVVK